MFPKPTLACADGLVGDPIDVVTGANVDGARDFVSGATFEQQSYFNERVDIHHIFPRAWCGKQTPPVHWTRYDSVINKTALSAASRSNRGVRITLWPMKPKSVQAWSSEMIRTTFGGVSGVRCFAGADAGSQAARRATAKRTGVG